MKRWLITGVSGGLGLAIAQAALDRGDMVFGTVRSVAARNRFEELAPGRSVAAILDLSDASVEIREVVESAATALGNIDVLVNNAGYCLLGALEEISEAEVAHIMTVNFRAPLEIIRAALPYLRDTCGRIINISSMAALQGTTGLGLYCASKAALTSATETLDAELRPFGIRATSVEATALRTGFAGSGLTSAAGRLPQYSEMRAQRETAFSLSNNNQPNDPAEIAQHVLEHADSTNPPVHVALGIDAAVKAAAICQARTEEYISQQ
ncbi:SDR family NAD(P)-dependent oxidoreductase [Croceicoccus ponticola]|uniref:SDR family NAD(P)-dependent oxidoreductase n=1 Tax=Croceicoccus ponticola TaxID=2217664 RepID=UPI0013E3DA15|nr:SDR family NAD(P)-dependent oxidoreductase [Croceicoccus ponticola]